MSYTDIGSLVRLKEYPWIPMYQKQQGIVLNIENGFGGRLYNIYLFFLKVKVIASISEFDFIRVKK